MSSTQVKPAPGLPTLTVPAAGTDDPATLAAVAVLDALPEPVRGQVLTVEVGAADAAGRPPPPSSRTR